MTAASADHRLTRYPIVLPVLCTARTPSRSGTQVGWTRNLSESGACLVLPERLPLTRPFHLGFQTDGTPLKAEGRVVWVGQSGFDLIRHGVAFTRIAPEHRWTLQGVFLSQGRVRPAGVRLSVALPVTCRCRGQARPPIPGWTGDISRGGLLLSLPQVLPAGTELVLTLRHPAGALTLTGTVIWADASKRRLPRESIRHGLQFTVLDAAVDLALARLLTLMPRPTQPTPRGRKRSGVSEATRSSLHPPESWRILPSSPVNPHEGHKRHTLPS